MHYHFIAARDAMKPEVIMIERSASIAEALEVMQTNNVSALIVKKRNERDAFGIILLADIAKMVLARDRSVNRVNVYEVMSKPVISVDPDMDVRYCARLFDHFGLTRAPVEENGQIIGMISYKELVFNGLCEMSEKSIET
ncbi:MAG: CBS domain-containing protein [Gammaproteobacteria bacterium]|nr:MAG: CBS domain-containing protein [Gammaproteobacteria bacterium]